MWKHTSKQTLPKCKELVSLYPSRWVLAIKDYKSLSSLGSWSYANKCQEVLYVQFSSLYPSTLQFFHPPTVGKPIFNEMEEFRKEKEEEGATRKQGGQVMRKAQCPENPGKIVSRSFQRGQMLLPSI